MPYSIKPGTECFVCRHAKLAYERKTVRYAGPWKKFKTTRSLHFGFPALCSGTTHYFVDGDWMMKVEIPRRKSHRDIPKGVSRIPAVKVRPAHDYTPATAWRRDSEKNLTGDDV